MLVLAGHLVRGWLVLIDWPMAENEPAGSTSLPDVLPRSVPVRLCDVTRLLRFDRTVARAVENYGAQLAASVHLGSGSGESHAYVVHFDAGGEIGEHETGFGQLFVVVDGSGWVLCGSDRYEVESGEAVFIPRGVVHAKGSESGMTAVMIQMYDLEPGQQPRG